MRHKFGSFYADWRDQFGKRHMKAFTTKKAAAKFGLKMRREATAKKAQAPRRLGASSRRSRKATRRATRAATPAIASAKRSAT